MLHHNKYELKMDHEPMCKSLICKTSRIILEKNTCNLGLQAKIFMDKTRNILTIEEAKL